MDDTKRSQLESLQDIYKSGFISEFEYIVRRAEITGDPIPEHEQNELSMNEKLQLLEGLLQGNKVPVPNITSEDLGIPTAEELWKIVPNEIKILKQIGKGYYSTVHLGMYHGLQVAVKHIVPSALGNLQEIILLEREISLLKLLRHPHIITFLGIIDTPGSQDIKIVTEFMENGDLRNYLKNKDKSIPWDARIRMSRDIASAMAYLHSHGIIFRDLKGRNLLLDKYLRVKICDFGLAKSYGVPMLHSAATHLSNSRKAKPKSPEVTTNLRRESSVVGTPAFMAPEIVKDGSYSQKADVFSYGLVLLEIITRKSIGHNIQRKGDGGVDLDLVYCALDYPPIISLISLDARKQFDSFGLPS
eukprot:TRINITY_DN383_c0_g1_i6.p1 TRINITY_DN383_c0_g1~~TRINITY_DN383_c0_g1_i6.p1  ORF type:complete len:367 (-),score=44.76 TRINITY_DN383_c0_g1_i6:1315-2391(-)